MVKNNDHSVKINHNLNCPYISDHPYRILIIGGIFIISWRSRKTNELLNLTKHQRPDIAKFFLHVNDPFILK